MTAGWIGEIENRRQDLHRQLQVLEQDGKGRAPRPADGASGRIQAARAALQALDDLKRRDDKLSRVLPHPRAREAAWDAVHGAEDALNAAMPDGSEDLLARAEDHARRSLNREEAAARLKVMYDQRNKAQKAREARAIIHDSHEASDKFLANLRAQNQANCALSLVIVVGLVALVWSGLGALVVPTPEVAGKTPATANDILLLTILFGAIGGVLSALFTVVTQPGYDDARYYDPRPGLMALKTSTGALFGLLGTLLIGTGSVVAEFSTVTGVALVALFFGYSQQAVTRVLDRKAKEYVEGSAQNSTATTTTATTAADET